MPSPPRTAPPALHAPETARVDSLRPHPRNYRDHPSEQRAHLVESIRENGFYRNVVVTRDDVILAGHGVVEAARETGLEEVGVVRLDFDSDDPRALKILAGDNEIARLAVDDDEVLADLLRGIRETDDLLGTGYSDADLDTLLRVLATGSGDPTTPEDEWVGMPAFTQGDRESVFHATVHFASEEAADRFFALVGVPRGRAFWWPVSDGLVGSDSHQAWVVGT